VHLLVTVQNVI